MNPGDIAIRDDQHYLTTVREIRALAERCDTVTDAKDLADRATAARVYAERARLGQEMVNQAGAAKLWAERRAGELLAAMPKETGGDAMKARSGTTTELPTLADIGVTKDESSEWQKLAAIPAEEFAEAIEVAADEGTVSRARVMAVHYSSATPEWATPQDLFDELEREFNFNLDVCATAENAKCRLYFTAEDDGLAQEWQGVCWMNPPYGDQIVHWVRKAYESSQLGATVVCLVPGRIDTGWFWDYCRHGEVRIIRGRLKFGGSDTGAPFPSTVVIFRPENNAAKVVWWERA